MHGRKLCTLKVSHTCTETVGTTPKNKLSTLIQNPHQFWCCTYPKWARLYCTVQSNSHLDTTILTV
jgi:hypothetical protein